MKYTVNLLTLNAPNLNGHVCTTEVIQKAIDNYKEMIAQKRSFVTSHMSESPEVNLEDVVGIVIDMNVEGDNLVGEVEFIEPLLSKHFPEYLPSFESQFNKTLFLRPSGMGTVKDGLIIDDYIINYFALTNDPA